jgi:putative flippase GtrA
MKRLYSVVVRHPLIAGRPAIRQFIKFSIVGAWNTIVDFLVYLALTRFVHIYYVAATIGSFLVAATISYFLNKFWTFRDYQKDRMAKQYLQFIFIGSIGALISALVLFCTVHFLHFYDLAGKAAAVVIVVIWNFFANKRWTFRGQ